MKIQAALLRDVGRPFEIEELELAAPRAGEVRVRMQAAGVCHSDWHLATGATRHPLPLVAGHEGAGVVDAVGEGVEGLSPGDRVILNWAPSCGTCFYCRMGRPNLCAAYLEPIWSGCMLDGTPRLSLGGCPVYHYCGLACFAETAVVPRESCVPLLTDIPPEPAALIGCAVATGVGAVLNTARIPAGASVAVFGAGGVGLSVIMGARMAGASPILAVDQFRSRCAAALDLGATDAFAADSPPLDRIRQATCGRGADFVLDTTGQTAVQESCIEAVRPGGTIVLVGLSPMGSCTNLPAALVTRRELTVMGSYYGTCDPERDFRRYADLLARGELPLDRLVSKTYALTQINDAFADMLEGRTARGVIVFPS